jgi:hypothetical protein
VRAARAVTSAGDGAGSLAAAVRPHPFCLTRGDPFGAVFEAAGRRVTGGAGSGEAAAGDGARVGDVFARAAEPAAAAFGPVWTGEGFGEAAQVLFGVGGCAAVALVLLGHGLREAGGDGFGRAVVGGALAGGAVLQAAELPGPGRDDDLGRAGR